MEYMYYEYIMVDYVVYVTLHNTIITLEPL